ncbi:hypothetical protein [Methanococcoides sp. FTZ1]|uniref:hypothetical protein n=1 Tax=Methanococcoides sp. FTZ1 TaxID=3439061 RepID=UPI003F84A7E9
MTQTEEDRSKLIYYLYQNETPDVLIFLGTLQGTLFTPAERVKTERNPNTDVVAMSKKGQNRYPGKLRIKDSKKHIYKDGSRDELTGYSYHYV